MVVERRKLLVFLMRANMPGRRPMGGGTAKSLTYARPLEFRSNRESASYLRLVNLHDTKHIQLASSLGRLPPSMVHSVSL